MLWTIFGPILGHFDPFLPQNGHFWTKKMVILGPDLAIFDFLGVKKSKISKIINSHKNMFRTIFGTV